MLAYARQNFSADSTYGSLHAIEIVVRVYKVYPSSIFQVGKLEQPQVTFKASDLSIGFWPCLHTCCSKPGGSCSNGPKWVDSFRPHLNWLRPTSRCCPWIFVVGALRPEAAPALRFNDWLPNLYWWRILGDYTTIPSIPGHPVKNMSQSTRRILFATDLSIFRDESSQMGSNWDLGNLDSHWPDR